MDRLTLRPSLLSRKRLVSVPWASSQSHCDLNHPCLGELAWASERERSVLTSSTV